MSEPHTKPFKGILLNNDKISDISSCVCPPYDVIASARTYYEKNPFNVIRLELPMHTPSMDKYNSAKETLKQWLEGQVLVPDTQEAIYVYEQEFIIENISYLRRGFIALNKLDKKRILTHEETRKKAKEDRERLITTLKTFTSLVFSLYEDHDNEIENLLINAEKDLIYDFEDEQLTRNRFYRMTDPAWIDTLAGLMEEKKIYIADGHHRLDVSFKLNLSYMPMYLTNMYSRGIVILPYHRTIKFGKDRALHNILSTIEDYADIEKKPLKDDNSAKSAFDDIASSQKPAFVLYSKDDVSHLYVLREKKACPMESNLHKSLAKLKVNILHAGILNGLLNIKDEEISYTQDAYKSINLVKRKDIDLALFLPPTTVEEVKDIADNGLYMPPKSTFFHPKILTGLVFYRYQ